MAGIPLPSADTLNQLLHYDPETGDLLWKPRPASMFNEAKRSPEVSSRIFNTRYAGQPAFPRSRFGYRRGVVMGYETVAHRVIWCMMTGAFPDGLIDHINGVRDDNRWSNLRVVSTVENCQNLAVRSDSTSGVTGVSRYARTGRWWAYIVINGKSVHLGLYQEKADAIAARRKAEADYGFHPNHGQRKATYAR